MDDEFRSRMSDELMRLSTFCFWRTTNSYPIYPTILASFEFFATGRGDEVECFRCGARISNWRPSDDPILRHPPVCVRRPAGNSSDRQAILLEEATVVHPIKLPSGNIISPFNGVVVYWHDNRESVPRDVINSASQLNSDSCCPFQCPICWEKKISVVFESCRHACCCSSCSEKCQSCPMCRGSVQEKFSIILPNCSHHLPWSNRKFSLNNL